jgi:hypothetical protein
MGSGGHLRGRRSGGGGEHRAHVGVGARSESLRLGGEGRVNGAQCLREHVGRVRGERSGTAGGCSSGTGTGDHRREGEQERERTHHHES